MKITIEGTRPLLMHNGDLADPMSEGAKKLAAVSKKRSKSEDDFVELARVEFEGGLYFDKKIGTHRPARLPASLYAGGRS